MQATLAEQGVADGRLAKLKEPAGLDLDAMTPTRLRSRSWRRSLRRGKCARGVAPT
jgi:hypothetical protein